MTIRKNQPHPDQYEFDFNRSAKQPSKPANDNVACYDDRERSYVSAETNWTAIQNSLRQVVAISELSCCQENAWALSDAFSILNDLLEEINCELRAATDCD